MNIWLKEISENDGVEYCNLLIELTNYKDAYARPVPSDFTLDDYETFKQTRIRMAKGIDLPKTVMPTSTYWVMDDDVPVGYATLKHRVDPNKIGGHLGLCLKKDYQNMGLGTLVSSKLSEIAYNDYGIQKLIYTSKNENVQSQKSLQNIGATLTSIHDGYHFYEVDLEKKYGNIERKK